MRSFRQYLVPRSVEEAVRLRTDIGSGALYIAGGTTIVPAASRGVQVLIDVSRLGRPGVRLGEASIRIGAATRLSALVTAEVESALPMLYEAAHRCATPLIRNMATIGGALSGIFLPSDIGIPLLALGAKVVLQGKERRVAALEELLPANWPPGDDLILEVEIPLPGERTGCGFDKFTRSEIDIALVNVAARVTISAGAAIEAMRIVVGQSASSPVLLKETDLPGAGESLSEDLLRRMARSASEMIKPKSDSKATAEYRRQLIEVLVARSIADAVKNIGVGLGD